MAVPSTVYEIVAAIFPATEQRDVLHDGSR